MMHSDSRVKEPVCLATTSLPDPCLSTYLSPRFREEPFLLAQGDGRQRLGELFAEVALAREMSPDVIEKARKAPLRAPLVITVVARIQPHDKVPPLEQQLSAGCAVMAMQMAAQAQGFGGIWRSGWFIFDRLIHQALGLHESDQIVGFLYLGTPATTPKPPRLLASDAFIRYL